MSTGEKFKSGASNLFSKTKTEIARTKQKAMVKFGKAEETVDVNYNNEKERFYQTYKAIKKISKDSQKLLDVVKELSIVQASLAEDFYELYENKADLYSATLKYQEVAKSIDAARIQLDEQLRNDLIEPISKYLGQYKDIKHRIKEEEVRKVDMDRYSRDVRTTNEKNKSVSTKEQKAENARINYTNLHDELIHDLPRLYEDRLPFLNPVFATYLHGFGDFYRNAARFAQEPLPLISHVNRHAAHDYPRIVTPPETSYSSIKTSADPHTGRATNVSSSTNPYGAPATQSSVIPPYNPSLNAEPSHTAPSHTGPIHTGPIHTESAHTAPVTTGRPMPTLPTRGPSTLGPKLTKATALYDFNPAESNELGFKIGDTIIIHKQIGDWWEGELNGKKGLLPSNYVQLC